MTTSKRKTTKAQKAPKTEGDVVRRKRRTYDEQKADLERKLARLEERGRHSEPGVRDLKLALKHARIAVATVNSSVVAGSIAGAVESLEDAFKHLDLEVPDPAPKDD